MLIHKKDNTTELANFRPNSLESVPLQIFISCTQDSLFSFVIANTYADNKIQRAFFLS